MDDLISRQAVIEEFAKQLNVDDDRVYKNGTRREYAIGYGGIKQVLESMPSAQPERKTGKWRRTPMACYGGGTITEYECSVCEEHQIITSNYCPNCGADMRGEQP